MKTKQSKKAEAEVRKLEKQLMRDKERLAKLRRKVPREPVSDYAFKDASGKAVKLSQLFGKKDDLILIHNMGTGCSSCTMWADGLNGLLAHLENRAAFVVESMDAPEKQKKFAHSRKWNFRMVSSQGTPFRQEMGYAGPKDNSPWPGVSTFTRDKQGRIFRVADTSFGPGDNFCVIWDLFDLLAQGVNGWNVKFRYGS